MLAERFLHFAGSPLDRDGVRITVGQERTHALQQIRGKNSLSVVHLVEQRPCLFQIERVEAVGR
jgi:hypothetical protein